MTGPGLSARSSSSARATSIAVQAGAAEEAHHGGAGQGTAEQVRVTEPLGRLDRGAHQPQAVTDPSEVHHDEQQLHEDTGPEPEVVPGLLQRLLQVPGRLAVAVVVQPHRGEQRQRLGPHPAVGELGEQLLQHRPGAHAAPRRRQWCCAQRIRRPGSPVPQLRGELEQLGRGRRGPTGPGPCRGVVERLDRLGVGPDRRQGEVPGTLLGVRDHARQATVHRTQLAGRRARADRRRQDRVGEADPAADDPDDVGALRGLEEALESPGVRPHGVLEPVHRGVGEGGGRDEHGPDVGGQAAHPVPQELVEAPGQGGPARPGVVVRQRPRQLEGVEGVAARDVVDALHPGPGPRAAEPAAEDRVQLGRRERRDGQPDGPRRCGQVQGHRGRGPARPEGGEDADPSAHPPQGEVEGPGAGAVHPLHVVQPDHHRRVVGEAARAG